MATPEQDKKITFTTWDYVTAPVWVPYYMILSVSAIVLGFTTPERHSANRIKNDGVYNPTTKDKVLDTAGNVVFSQWNKGVDENDKK